MPPPYGCHAALAAAQTSRAVGREVGRPTSNCVVFTAARPSYRYDRTSKRVTSRRTRPQCPRGNPGLINLPRRSERAISRPRCGPARRVRRRGRRVVTHPRTLQAAEPPDSHENVRPLAQWTQRRRLGPAQTTRVIVRCSEHSGRMRHGDQDNHRRIFPMTRITDLSA